MVLVALIIRLDLPVARTSSFVLQCATAKTGPGVCGRAHSTAFFKVATAVACTPRVPAGS